MGKYAISSEVQIPNIPEVSDLQLALNAADWTFEQTEDHDVWVAGRRKQHQILIHINTLIGKNQEAAARHIWNSFTPSNKSGGWWQEFDDIVKMAARFLSR